MEEHWSWAVAAAAAAAVWWYTAVRVWWAPRRIRNHYLKQGIRGPKYRLFLGNLRDLAALTNSNNNNNNNTNNFSHNILPRVLFFYHHWKKLYGSMVVIWFGATARVTVSDPAMIVEILGGKSSEVFEKCESPPLVREIEGDGLLNLPAAHKWALHRRIIQPIFHLENLKLMTPMMAKSMEEAVMKWSQGMSNSAATSGGGGGGGKVEIEVSEWFQHLSEDAIIRAVFGSRSYEAGRAIFKLQSQQMAQAAEAYQTIFIPGYRFLPTKKNRISWKLEKQVRKSLLEVIDQRMRSQEPSDPSSPSDLLEVMIKASLQYTSGAGESWPSITITANDVVEECKTLLFAGKQTTSNMLTWTTVLLAMHPTWQEQAREEVLRVCGARDTPTKDDLAKLKTLEMILKESLRLYPPAVALIRRARENVKVGGVHILGGTEVLIPILAVHHDPGLWCHDAHEFNPARFAKGVARAASHPMAFMPFGIGSRRCVGQNLAVLQAKLAVAMILQRFSFELAPTYKHAPALQLMLHPQYGAPVVFRKL
ncbi:cytochrome P450 734A1-like isoform X2 [Andrographis paniculata]|uniref:cytochrome P450 734A1-like isoform X2 n=1 Tax=Andrographis paniculata TaxID=175694 RepID=UPI0021E8F75B|nr:cytochrome P450 734A1-like isoform X2 [Andrographis paniculata]